MSEYRFVTTEDVRRWIKSYHLGQTIQRIADFDGVNHKTVSKHLRRVGVKTRPPGPRPSRERS